MLKVSNDQLSKAWKPIKTWKPFYKGGKCSFSDDGQRIICEFEGNIKLVNSSDVSEAENFFEEDSLYEAVSCFAVHPNWQEIVIATVKFSLTHWIIEGRQQRKTIKAHRMPILCMDYDSSGTLVATGSADKSIRVWDVARGYCTHSFSEHSDILKTIVFYQPTGQKKQLYLVSTSEDNAIGLFDLYSSKNVAFHTEHVSVPTNIALAFDGTILASCGRDKILNFYDMKSHRHLLTSPVLEELEALVVLPPHVSKRLLDPAMKQSTIGKKEAEVLVTAGARGLLRFYRLSLQAKSVDSLEVDFLFAIPVSSLDFHRMHAISEDMANLLGVSSLRFLSSSEELVVTTNDYNICYYSISDLCSFLSSTPPPPCASAGSHSIHISSSLLSSTIPTYPRASPSRLLVGNHGDILDIVSLPSSSSIPEDRQFVLVTNSHQLRVMNGDFSCRVLEGHHDIILSVDVSPNGDYLVTSSKDRTCRVWSVSLGTCVAVGEGHTEAVGAVCMSHFPASYQSRKAFMISGASDKIIKRWPLPFHSFPTSAVASLQPSHSVRGHDKDINCVSVSPNDSIVASASQDKTIRLWNSEDLSAIATLRGHKRGVWKVLFSPQEKILFSCSGDRTVKLWSIDDYSVLKTLEGNTASVLNVRLTHLGQQCITASADGLLRLYSLRNQTCERVMEEHEDRVWAIETFYELKENRDATQPYNISNAEHYLISGGSDSRIVLWKDVTREEEELAIQEREQRLVQEQQLFNFLSRKNYLAALSLALQLKHAQKVLAILQAVLEDVSASAAIEDSVVSAEGEVVEGPAESEDILEFQQKGEKSVQVSEKFRRLFERQWSKALDPYLLQLTPDHRKQLVFFLKDWNTNSRHCYLSQILINSFLRLFPVADLLQLEEWKELLAGFHAYTDRHYQRMSRVLQASYYINYMIAAIQGFMPLEAMNRLTLPDYSRPPNCDEKVATTSQLLLKDGQDVEEEISYTVSTNAAALEEEQRSDEVEEVDIRRGKRSFSKKDESETRTKKKRKTPSQ